MNVDKVQNTNEQDGSKKAMMEQMRRIGLPGFELASDAHISLQTAERLERGTFLGSPLSWMPSVGRKGAIPNYVIPPALLDRLELMDREEADTALGHLTVLANTGNPEDKFDRKYYQENVKILADLAKQTVLQDIQIFTPDETLSWVALRGAEFFEPMYSELSGGKSNKVETKRLKGLGGTYAVATGPVISTKEQQIEQIKQIILFDDCLSTGMSQMENMRLAFEKGYRPEQIVMPIVVATVDGYDEVMREAERIKVKYGVEFKLIITCAAICHSVDGDMYLRTPDGMLYLVGDMGEFLKALKALEA